MHDGEAIEMMKRASEEIKSLRRERDALAPKAHAYDTLTAVLGLLPRPSQGYGEDVAGMLDKRIKELQAEKAKQSELI